MTKRYKQTKDKSCGAVALMCAAAELGITALPRFGKFAFVEKSTPLLGNTAEVFQALLKWDGTDYRCAFASSAVELALYAVTSGDLQSYSLPSRVVGCARLLGLQSKLYAPSGFLKSVLMWNYPEEREKCEAQPDVTVSDDQSGGPVGDERELKIMTSWFIGLHYVLKRPSAETDQYMDPGDGQNFKEFSAMNSAGKNYSDTGISIILKKKT